MGSDREKREYARIQTDEPVSIVPFAGSTLLARSLDVSLGGIRFQSLACELAPDELVQISFNLGEATIEAVGRVVWTKRLDDIATELAVEFVRIDPWAARLLENERIRQRSKEQEQAPEPGPEPTPQPADQGPGVPATPEPGRSQGSDRRRHERIETEHLVSIKPFGGNARLGQGLDVSQSGISFEVTDCTLEPDEFIELRFNVDQQSVEAVGRVVRAAPLDDKRTAVAVEFVRIDPWAERLLERLRSGGSDT